MTKKHFEAFAQYIREYRDLIAREGEQSDAPAAMAYMVADVSARENPRFDRTRFLKACGLAS